MNMTAKKFMSVILSLVLICSMGLIASATDTLEGEGTKDSPYLIKTASDLDTLSALTAEGNSFSGKYISLENDVTASADFTPIGTKDAPFSGNFLGNGNTLSGFDLDTDYAALFGCMKRAAVSDVVISGTFYASSYAGSIAAYAENSEISGCVSSSQVYSDNYTGGIAGFVSGGKISGCKTANSAVVVGYEENCGGIAGFSSAEINSCENAAYIRGNKNVGGIAGTSEGKLISSVNSVSVSASEGNLGGIAGLAKGEIKYCKNTGRISASNAGAGKTGGIAGVMADCTLSECISTGAVSGTGEYAGGIAGYVTGGKISDCVAAGSVSTISDFAGGIFGSTSKTEVVRCLFTGAVTANSEKIAAIGAISGGTVADCYYDSEKNEKAFVSAVSASGAKGITASDMLNEAAFNNWDFTKVWEINELHASYPLLKNVPFHTLSVVSETAANCTEEGVKVSLCSVCHGEVRVTSPATGHTLKVVSEKLPSCSVAGYRDEVCENCTYTSSEDIPALGHKDADSDKKCDLCGSAFSGDKADSEKSIFQKIADFFRSILDWFRNLFK